MQAGRWVLGTGGMREGSPHGAPGVPPCQGWERSNGNRGWVGGDVPLAAPNAVPVEPLGAIRPIAGVLQGCTAPSCHPHPWAAAAGQGLGVIAAGGGRAAAVRRPARSVPVRPPEQHHVPQGALTAPASPAPRSPALPAAPCSPAPRGRSPPLLALLPAAGPWTYTCRRAARPWPAARPPRWPP